MADVQVEPVVVDPLAMWWAGKKAPKSQLTEQLEGSLLITDADIPASVSIHAPEGANMPETQPSTETRTRKRRSDAGVPKGPKLVPNAIEPAGLISKEQKSRLLMAVGLVQEATRQLMQAELSFADKRKQLDQAEKDLATCLDELSISGMKS